MRAKLDAMGPVNMMALEEYRETAERHTFLDAQRKDLISSIENTTATIREIDEVSRQKFQEAFAKINENFQATFKKLFGGGHAFMKLTDEENSRRERHRRGRIASRQAPAKRAAALGRREGAHRAGPVGRHFPVHAQPVLHSRRSRRAARRGQHRPLHGAGEGDERQDSVRPHHAQQEDDEHRAGALRRDHAGAGSVEAGVGAVRSGVKA